METIFRERLKFAMATRGYNQATLSKLSGLSKPLICKYIKGEYKASNTNLVKLSNALRVNAGWLLGLTVDMEANVEQKNNNIINDIVDLLEDQDESTLKTILKVIKSIVQD